MISKTKIVEDTKRSRASIETLPKLQSTAVFISNEIMSIGANN